MILGKHILGLRFCVGSRRGAHGWPVVVHIWRTVFSHMDDKHGAWFRRMIQCICLCLSPLLQMLGMVGRAVENCISVENSLLTHFYSAINGILAMAEFRQQFASRCSQGETVGGNFNLCPKDSSIIVAILSAGTALGALLAAPIGDHLGRRRSLLISVLLFCVGAICQVCANAIPLLLVGR